MRGNIAVTRAFLTLYEVIAHLDLLRDERRVREAEDDGVVPFEAWLAEFPRTVSPGSYK